ncbi:MAG TPA: hypothetical protein VEY12_04640 [Thermoplasmata archaeon]|nr:hypothetical protein [Thermoplasmata archaeon]
MWLVLFSGAILSAGGIACGAVMVALAAVAESQLLKGRWAARMGALAFVLMLAAALEVMLGLPTALNQASGGSSPIVGFWGSIVTGPSPGLISWGAGWGWDAALVAAALFLIGSLLLFRARAQSTKSETPKTGPPQ